MAQDSVKHIELTAAGGTFLLPVFQTTKDTVHISSTGTITLVNNVIISISVPTMGTLEDTRLIIKWGALVVPNGYTVTIFGRVVPNSILAKRFIADCYYTGVSWEVRLLVDIDGVLSLINGDSVITTTNSSPVVTVNSGAIQTLVTLNIPSDTFQNAGDRIKATITGLAASNANGKTLFVGLHDGTNPDPVLNSGLSSLDLENHFIVEYEIMATNILSGHYKISYKVFGYSFGTGTNLLETYNTVNTSVPALNFTSASLQFRVRARENVPTGGEIEIRSVAIERVKA